MENNTTKSFYNTNVPSDWEVKELGKLVDEKRPVSYGIVQTGELVKDGVPCIRVTDIVDGKIDTSNLITTSKKISNSYKRTILRKGDLVMALRGKIGQIAKIEEDLVGANLTRGVALIAVKELYDNDFLRQQISSEKAIQIFERSLNGSALQELSIGIVRKIPILLPKNLPEQRAIAHVLSLMDSAINTNNQLIAQKELRKKWLMQNLLTGKKRLKGFSGEWKEVKLEKVANIRRGASPRPIQNPKWFSEKGRGWIRISDVTKSNFYLNQTTQYLSNEGVDKSVKVDKGDLIMSICATIGIPVIVNIPACIHDGFVLFREYEKNLTTFFLYYFIQYITEKLSGEGQPGTQKNLNTTIVGNIQLNLPSILEQTAIAQVLQAADKEIQLLKTKTEKLREQKKGMMQVLLTGKKRLNYEI